MSRFERFYNYTNVFKATYVKFLRFLRLGNQGITPRQGRALDYEQHIQSIFGKRFKIYKQIIYDNEAIIDQGIAKENVDITPDYYDVEVTPVSRILPGKRN